MASTVAGSLDGGSCNSSSSVLTKCFGDLCLRSCRIFPHHVLAFVVAAILIPAISNHSSSAVLLIPILIVAGILGILPVIRAGLSYSQVFYILADNPTTGAYEAIQLSVSMMDGQKWKLFCLGFRFIGWFLLCILTCFIGFLWLYPYMTTSYAHFYDDVRGN